MTFKGIFLNFKKRREKKALEKNLLKAHRKLFKA